MKQMFLTTLARGVAIPIVVLSFGSLVHADTLESVEVQVTVSDFYDTSPTLGIDSTSEIIVYTTREYLGNNRFGPGDILAQRLNVDGTLRGPVIQVSSGLTDDLLNDVSGSRVVYTAFESTTSLQGKIMLYDVPTGVTTALMTEIASVREARIEGDIVVWTQGSNGTTRINYLDLAWPTGTEPIVIGGPNPPVASVDIGNNFVVWEQIVNDQRDIGGYDIMAGDYVSVSAVADLHERLPSTHDDIVVWQAFRSDGTSSIMLADFGTIPATRYTVVDNGAANYAPSVYGDVVAYESSINSGDPFSRDIFLYRISDAAIFPVTNDTADQTLNNLFGNKVAYVDDRNPSLDVFVSTFEFVPDDPCADLGGDTDDDGVCDAHDNCVALANADQLDSDGDGLGNVCDNCVDHPNPDQADQDGDTLGDACDPCPNDPGPDPDDDGVCSGDNCPQVSNPDQADGDGDGSGDVCDSCPADPLDDGDSDGHCADVDNCPVDANPDQVDSDSDQLGDVCDVCPFDATNDGDGDGICEDVDLCPGDPTNTCGTICLNPVVLDFELDAAGAGLAAGTLIHDQYADLGVHIFAANNNCTHPDRAIIFDSGNPTGGDWDLRTPGSGVGNDEALGNILIIAEHLTDLNGDDLVDSPDDEAAGGEMIFIFDEPVVLTELTLIDVEEQGAFVTKTASGGGSEVPIPALTDNSVQIITFEPVPVTSAAVALPASGAVDRITFCPAK